MNTARLYEFLVLAKVLNYSKAAKALYISQSVLSRHMQELEKEFGCALLVRSTHGVTLTEAGRVLANDGGALIKKCESALSHLREQKGPAQGKVRVGMCLEFSYSGHIRRFLQQFARDYPQIELIYDVLPFNTPQDTVTDYDVFFTPCDFPDLPAYVERIAVDRHGIYAILPPNHTLLSKASMHLYQLKGQTLVVPYANELFGPYARNYLLAEKAAKGQLSHIDVDNLSTALFLVSMGKGICLAPHYARNLLPHDTFVVAVSDQNCRFSEYLYYCKKENSVAELFFQEFKRQHHYARNPEKRQNR